MKTSRDRSICIDLPSTVSTSILSDMNEILCRETDFSGIYLRDSIFSKYIGEDTVNAEDRKRSAIVKWLGVEHLNERTTARVWNSEAYFSFGNSEKLLQYASDYVRKIIGLLPPDDLLYGSFSNGASTSKRLEVGIVAKKFTGQADVTPRAWRRISDMLSGCETWRALTDDGVLKPRFVKGNIMFTVPKSTVIDRVCCKEPDFNMFAQRGVGDFIRSQLRHEGIDLNDQSVNRSLAWKGSKFGTLATLDLSSASDTVSTGIVARLLPPAWFSLLDDLRCDVTIIDEVEHRNHMFSSMGNGFTFELESLIFYSLARAVAKLTRIRGRISVYGDDLIVPVRLAPMLAVALSWCGFKLNRKKSFWNGDFRESCGGHYYRGCDVTPFYVKEPVTTLLHLIHFLNRLRAWMIRTGRDDSSSEYYTLWLKFAALVPRALWGGFDLESKLQLVSPGRQRCKLQQMAKELRGLTGRLQSGLYLASLRRLDSRTVHEIGFPNRLNSLESSLGLVQEGFSLLSCDKTSRNHFLRYVESTTTASVDSTLKQDLPEFEFRRVRDFSRTFGVVKPLFSFERDNFGYVKTE